MLFQAGSSDGIAFYEIQIIGSDLLILRDFGQCTRSVNRTPHNFKRGESSRLVLTWNGPSTRFFINDREIKGFNLLVNNDSRAYRPVVNVGETDGFDISDIRISSNSDIAVDPADREFVKNFQCPHLEKLAEGNSQEEYKGISLHNFPDQSARDKIKSYIDLLPGSMAGFIKHIILADAAQGMNGIQGLTKSQDTFYLRTGSEPITFFHEAAHIYDINSNEMKSKQWAEQFMRDKSGINFDAASYDPDRRNTSVLSMHDGSAAPEQLADFVGHVYEFYLNNRIPR